jgi:hypothetical protein
MTRYAYLKQRIERLEIIGAKCDELAKKMIAHQVLTLTTILEGYTLMECEKEIA